MIRSLVSAGLCLLVAGEHDLGREQARHLLAHAAAPAGEVRLVMGEEIGDGLLVLGRRRGIEDHRQQAQELVLLDQDTDHAATVARARPARLFQAISGMSGVLSQPATTS